MSQENFVPALYVILVVLVSSLVMLNIYRTWSIRDARRHIKLSHKGKATMFDVRHLLMEGQKELAIRVYSDIFNMPLARARKDVEDLQRSMKV